MICPICDSEYRPGITRCVTCDVSLVDHGAGAHGGTGAPARPSHRSAEPLADYCGFIALDDARHARDALRSENIPSEIVIREADDASFDEPVREEYWLRVPVRRFDAVMRIVGYDAGEAPTEAGDDDDSFACSVCGARVADSDDACPGCGAKFEG